MFDTPKILKFTSLQQKKRKFIWPSVKILNTCIFLIVEHNIIAYNFDQKTFPEREHGIKWETMNNYFLNKLLFISFIDAEKCKKIFVFKIFFNFCVFLCYY